MYVCTYASGRLFFNSITFINVGYGDYPLYQNMSSYKTIYFSKLEILYTYIWARYSKASILADLLIKGSNIYSTSVYKRSTTSSMHVCCSTYVGHPELRYTLGKNKAVFFLQSVLNYECVYEYTYLASSLLLKTRRSINSFCYLEARFHLAQLRYT